MKILIFILITSTLFSAVIYWLLLGLKEEIQLLEKNLKNDSKGSVTSFYHIDYIKENLDILILSLTWICNISIIGLIMIIILSIIY